MGIKVPKNLIVIKDSREQKGWHFQEEEAKPGKVNFVNTEIAKLDAGDYSVKGLEDLVTIERKNGFCELFGNMSPKANRERFEREMERMGPIKHKFVFIESQLNQDILTLSPGQVYKGPPARKVLEWLSKIEIEYGVSVKFVGECGKTWAKRIFEQVARDNYERFID